jgi:hypothetical protein
MHEVYVGEWVSVKVLLFLPLEHFCGMQRTTSVHANSFLLNFIHSVFLSNLPFHTVLRYVYVVHIILVGNNDVICAAPYTSLSVCLSVYGSTTLCWTLAAFSVSWSYYTVGRTLWMGDQPVARQLPAHRTAETQNKRTQTSIPQVGFEPTIPVFEQAKTVHALESTATVIGCSLYRVGKWSQLTLLCLSMHWLPVRTISHYWWDFIVKLQV